MGSYFDMRSFDDGPITSVSNKSSTVATALSNILVVDDSILVRKQMGRILNAGNYNILEYCSGGQDAVDQYKKHFPNVNLVTMDVSMPGVDGLKALELILEFDADAKVLMICALGKEDTAKKAVEFGARGYVVKPLFAEDVINKVSGILRAK